MKKLKLKSIIIPLMTIAFLTSCNNGGNVPPEPGPKTYNVTCVDDVTISNPCATEGTKYTTTITTKNKDYLLPEKLNQVTIDGYYILTDYAYNKESDNLAYFAIEGKYIIGNIDIGLVCNYTVSSDEHIELKKTAVSKTKYETTIQLLNEEGCSLPKEANDVKVTINEQPFSLHFYRRKSPTEANLTIDGQYITGPITINFSYIYTVNVTNGITLSKKTAKKGEQYEATLTVPEGYILSDTIKQITIGGKVLSEYTYTPLTDTEAVLSIPGEYITAPINIELSYDYQVNITDGATISKTTATPGEDYEVTITSDRTDYFLPTKLVDVTINGKSSTNYTYDWKSNAEASFSIAKQYITGPIGINLIYNYAVTSSNDVVLSNEHAVPGEKYVATITPSRNGYLLPETLTSVTINGETSTNYTYTRKSTTEANFIIGAQYITGPINIDLTCDYIVTIDEHFTISQTIVSPGIKYEATIQPYSGYYFLAKDITKVTIGGEVSTNYTYNWISKSEATFSIEGEYVTGPIDITLEYGRKYSAALVATGGETITLSSDEINTLEDYEATISFSDETYSNKKMPAKPSSVTSKGLNVEYTYTIDEIYPNTAHLKIDKSLLKGDVKITLPALPDKSNWYDFKDWWNYCSNGVEGQQAASADIGHMVGVQVNNLMHRVRLIDIDHDEIASSNDNAHCTFEFVDTITKVIDPYPIPDSSKWHDSRDSTNFPNSSLNSNLKTTILPKLPDDLQSIIKTVNKKVGVLHDGSETWELATYSTQLFPLAYAEIVIDVPSGRVVPDEGTIYTYYATRQGNDDRTKQCVNSTKREEYWLRSPWKQHSSICWYVVGEGEGAGSISNAIPDFNKPIAPAFCI